MNKKYTTKVQKLKTNINRASTQVGQVKPETNSYVEDLQKILKEVKSMKNTIGGARKNP